MIYGAVGSLRLEERGSAGRAAAFSETVSLSSSLNNRHAPAIIEPSHTAARATFTTPSHTIINDSGQERH